MREMQSVPVVVGLLTTRNDKNPASPPWPILAHPAGGINQRDWTTSNQSLASPSSLRRTLASMQIQMWWYHLFCLDCMKRRCQCHQQH